MRFTVALLATLLTTTSAFADDDRKDPTADKLLTAGAAVFTIAYAPMTISGTVYSIFTAGDPGVGARFFTPIVGPFMWANDAGAYFGRGSNLSVMVGTLAALDGIAQVGGIALMIAGGVHRHRVAARATPSLSLR